MLARDTPSATRSGTVREHGVVRPSPPVRLPPPGTHGGDGPAVAAALGIDPSQLLDLSQNLNPLAPDVARIAARHLGALRTYPDPREATALLAGELGVDPDRLLLTNGGAEAIALVTAEVGGRVRSEPEFALHPRGTAGPVWRTDPHSPTGVLARPDERADVWDEAFHGLATGRWGARRPGAVALGSLTKTFACPGLRLGYAVARDAGERERLAARQPHWSVSPLALAVLPELLAAADLPGWAAGIATLRARLVTLLEGYGLQVSAGAAPWVLVRTPGAPAGGTDLRALLAPHGVLVRDCASFGIPGTARLAVPDEDGLDRVGRALERALG